MRFSRPTLVALADALAERGHTRIGATFYEYAVEGSDPGGNAHNRALALIRAIAEPSPRVVQRGDDLVEEHADDAEIEAQLLDLAEQLLASPIHVKWRDRLAARLRTDGLDYLDGHLVPTTPAPAAVGAQITALEAGMQALGLDVARTHYRQSVDNFTDGNWEAANGQLRSYLDALLVGLANRICGTDRTDPQAALGDLRGKKFLDDAEWNTLRSFLTACQDNGPHAGLSDPDEALFRLHVATAAGRYLLQKAGS